MISLKINSIDNPKRKGYTFRDAYEKYLHMKKLGVIECVYLRRRWKNERNK